MDVFAYHNEYPTSELRLNPEPYSFHAAAFDSKKGDFNLAGLAHFFSEGPELRGASLKKSDGLVLFGAAGAKQTLAGEPVELSDLAVAYRAVFHAGDNEAFISLDPHKDPTKVTVNFGGFLENTRIGLVVLEADKRFKTITSGLDPNSCRDTRAYTRTRVPAFLSGAERGLLEVEVAQKSKWESTRFWYYPDSIGVDSDLNYETAVVTNPRFTADAERSRDDFGSPEEFARGKREKLSPSIRANIDDLNRNYTQYADAFPEIAELATVARFLGICSWLFKAHPTWLDCDELLDVVLPPCETESTRTQLISATYFTHPSAEVPAREAIIDRSTVVFLSPILEKTVNQFFLSERNIAKYLSDGHELSAVERMKIDVEAARLFNVYRDRKVRDMIQSESDLKLLANYASGDVEPPRLARKDSLKLRIDSDEQALADIESKIAVVKRQMSAEPNATHYNALVDEHNGLVSEHSRIHQRYKQSIDEYNALRVQTNSIVRIGGGISLEPSKFGVRENSSSPKLIDFNNLIPNVGTRWTAIGNAEKWIKSEVTSRTEKGAPRIQQLGLDTKSEASKIKHWETTNAADASWRSAVKLDASRIQEKSFDAQKQQLQVAEFASGQLRSLIVGQKEAGGRIVFEKSERKGVLPPQDPPSWYSRN